MAPLHWRCHYFFLANPVDICYSGLVMEKRIHLYVSRKNVLTWLMALCMVGSAVARVIIYSGVEGVGVWSQIVLPVAATLLFVLISVICGQEMFYKTAIPVFMMAVYCGIWVCTHMDSVVTKTLFCICLVFFCVLYTEITCGRLRYAWLLFPLIAAPVAVVLYYNRAALATLDTTILLSLLPDLLILLGGLLLSFAVRIHSDGKYHPTWGDRSDGRRIRTLDPMAQVSPYIQVERNIRSNFFEESFEITNADRYIRQKRREGLSDFGITHVLLAAYVLCVAKYPQINRFISGQKVYSRGEDIQYCMVVKKDMRVDAPDTSIKVHLHPGDTAVDVYNKLNAAVESAKATQELNSGFDNLAMVISMIPGVFLKFVVWLLKFLDYFGLLPKFLLELSPFHGSLFFTSMGSLGIQPIYHHLYDFGNLPVFGAFGCKRRANEVLEDGTIVQRKYIDIKFVLDECTVDGYGYATFFKYFRRLLAHPEVLDHPPEVINKDID